MTNDSRRMVLCALGAGLLLWSCESAPAPTSQQPAPKPAETVPVQLDLNHPLGFGMKNGRPAVVFCSERIVELPFVHRHLPYPFRGRLLDVGYRESEVIYQMSSLGFDTWAIDIRPAGADFTGVHYIQGDVIKFPFPPRSFDVVIGLSTVEHIGLFAYGNIAKDPEGDLHALQAINRALKPGGRLLLTVPYGKRGAAQWYRVYDHQALMDRLKAAGFRAEVEDYWTQKDEVHWAPTSWKDGEKVDSLSAGARGVACIVARPMKAL